MMVVRSHFEHFSQLHWIAEIHPGGIMLSVAL